MAASHENRGVALFDLDQTLHPWDTQLLFCNWILRAEPLRRLYLLLFLPALPLAKVLGSEGMKRIFLSFLWGMRRERLEELVREFVGHIIPAICYDDLLEELVKENMKGRRVILVSASPEFYVKPIGDALGVDASFGTRVEFGTSVPLFPDFTGGNNKGAVKVARLKEELGIAGPQPDSAGYSDSKADLPMLELCEEITAVNPEGSFERRAEEKGWRILRPARPYRDRRAFGWRCLRQMCGFDRV
ncbi:MAG: HAD-IB family phosphatase [Akkermansiaceae bacterium]|nr:HAD-IB family phosphatase [Akkermansiaceae bacterium]